MSAQVTLYRLLGFGLTCTGLLLLIAAAGSDDATVVQTSNQPTSADATRECSGLQYTVRALTLERDRLADEVKALKAARRQSDDQQRPPSELKTPPPALGVNSPSASSDSLVSSQVTGAFSKTSKERSAVAFWAERDATYAPASRVQTFRQISDRMRDDKSFKHRYDVPYTVYLEPLRVRSGDLTMFEIGLGCDQERIGASVMMWGEYLPQSRLTVFEFDEKCGRKFVAEHSDVAPKGGFNMFYGDQASADDLNRALKADGDRQYDIIIDDGGHTMQQQINSFKVLWPRVKRGGLYVVEDLNTSFKSRYGGVRRPNGPQGTSAAATMTNFLKDLADEVHAVPVAHHAGKFVEDVDFKSPIARIDCHHFICFITKRA